MKTPNKSLLNVIHQMGGDSSATNLLCSLFSPVC